jgi:hypothetical protein
MNEYEKDNKFTQINIPMKILEVFMSSSSLDFVILKNPGKTTVPLL